MSTLSEFCVSCVMSIVPDTLPPKLRSSRRLSRENIRRGRQCENPVSSTSDTAKKASCWAIRAHEPPPSAAITIAVTAATSVAAIVRSSIERKFISLISRFACTELSELTKNTTEIAANSGATWESP
jgi:uncharacterized membrane protein